MPSWSPTHGATDIRKIITNLLAYLTTNQVEALAWASPSRLLAPATLYPNAEILRKTDFPHWGVVKRKAAIDDGDAGLKITYDLTTQLEVRTTYADGTSDAIVTARTAALAQLQLDTDNYAYAIESMILNIPPATLFANIRGVGHGYISVTSLDPLEMAITDTEAIFNVEMQIVMIFTENP